MEPNPPTARRSGSSLLCKTSQRSACSSTSAAAGQRRMDPFSDGTGMKKGLLTLPSAEMCTWCACWVAARIAGGDREAIQQPQAIFEAFGRRRLPILRRQHRPEPGEGLAPPGLHRLLRLLQIAQGLFHPVRRSIGQGQHGEPWLWSRTRLIQLKGDGATPASTGRFEAPPEKARAESPEKIFAGANLFIGLRSMFFLGGGA